LVDRPKDYQARIILEGGAVHLIRDDSPVLSQNITSAHPEGPDEHSDCFWFGSHHFPHKINEINCLKKRVLAAEIVEKDGFRTEANQE